MTDNIEVTAEDLDNVRHMTGAVSNVSKRNWGYRNHYCACKEGPDMASMERLKAAGYVVQGRDQGSSVFFHATEAGCKAIGLKPYQIKNALGG